MMSALPPKPTLVGAKSMPAKGQKRTLRATKPSGTPLEDCSPTKNDLGVWRSSSQTYLARLIDRRLLFALPHPPDVRDPWLPRASPYLHIGGDLIALTNCTHSNGVNLGSCTDRRRVYVRSTFRAERLWPL